MQGAPLTRGKKYTMKTRLLLTRDGPLLDKKSNVVRTSGKLLPKFGAKPIPEPPK